MSWSWVSSVVCLFLLYAKLVFDIFDILLNKGALIGLYFMCVAQHGLLKMEGVHMSCSFRHPKKLKLNPHFSTVGGVIQNIAFPLLVRCTSRTVGV